jgi:hypothetical protein
MTELQSLPLSQEALIKANLNSLSESRVNLASSNVAAASSLYAGIGSSSQSFSSQYTQPQDSDHAPCSYYSRGRGNNRGRGCGRFNSSNSDKPFYQICFKYEHIVAKCYHYFDVLFWHTTIISNTTSCLVISSSFSRAKCIPYLSLVS